MTSACCSSRTPSSRRPKCGSAGRRSRASRMSVRVAALAAADHPRWLELARGYKAFYKTAVTDAECARAWRRLLSNDRVSGLGAHLDGKLVGITHYLFHSATWNDKVCYLQDLFVDPAVRGRGIARALIEGVAAAALAPFHPL